MTTETKNFNEAYSLKIGRRVKQSLLIDLLGDFIYV